MALTKPVMESTAIDCPTCYAPAGVECEGVDFNHIARGLALAVERSPYEPVSAIVVEEPVAPPRKHPDGIGFTPFAYRKLVTLTDDGDGFPRDTKKRTFIMFGRDARGKRIRRELRATMYGVWLDYSGRWGYTRLWVEWKDGTRHLVHRKA